MASEDLNDVINGALESQVLTTVLTWAHLVQYQVVTPEEAASALRKTGELIGSSEDVRSRSVANFMAKRLSGYADLIENPRPDDTPSNKKPILSIIDGGKLA